MRTVPVAVKEGTYTLYDAEGDCVGRICTDTGRAMIGDAFYRKDTVCRNIYAERRHPMEQTEGGFECSACGFSVEDYESYSLKIENGKFNFCPNCGAQVIG